MQAVSRIQKLVMPVTTDSAGVATELSAKVSGFVHSIHYLKTDYTDGVDFTITTSETLQTIWTELNVNAAAAKAPRQATHSNAGVASLYDTTDNEPVEDRIALADEKISIVLAAGGDTKSGTFIVILEN